MASDNEASDGNGKGSLRDWKAATCVLNYLYELTQEDDGEYDDELLVYGRLAVSNKFLEREFWQRQKLMWYSASFTHYAHSRTKRRRVISWKPQ